MVIENSSNMTELPLLTFNSLYNFLSIEKKNKALQNLPELFYEALAKYLKDKKEEMEKLKKYGELEKLKKEKNIYMNSNKLIKELLNIRCVKISNIIIKNHIFGEEILSEDNILKSELIFSSKLKDATKNFVGGIIK